MTRRRHLPALAASGLAAVALAVTGCGPGDDDASAQDGALLGVDDIAPTFEVADPAPGTFDDESACRVDAPSLFPGLDPEHVATYERQVEGGTETVLVGAWEQDYDTYKDALTAIAERKHDPSCPADEKATESVRLGNVLDFAFERNLTSFTSRYWADGGPGAGADTVTTRLYTWGDGHVVTAWVTRTGGSDPDSTHAFSLLDRQAERLDLDPSVQN